MKPDVPIYRKTESGEFACIFSKDTIREISQVFARKGLFNKTNLNHSVIPADSYVFQSFITDERISCPAGLDCPIGSWIVGLKVQSDDVWQKIKSGELNGFSVEGIFQLIDTNKSVNMSKQNDFEAALTEFETAFIACFN